MGKGSLLCVCVCVSVALLTEFLHHNLPRGWVVEAAGELWAVPHQQLLVGGDGLHRVEVDAHAILAGGKVLLLFRVGRVHEAHPVALLLVQPVHEVMELAVRVNLQKGGENVRRNVRGWLAFRTHTQS